MWWHYPSPICYSTTSREAGVPHNQGREKNLQVLIDGGASKSFIKMAYRQNNTFSSTSLASGRHILQIIGYARKWCFLRNRLPRGTPWSTVVNTCTYVRATDVPCIGLTSGCKKRIQSLQGKWFAFHRYTHRNSKTIHTPYKTDRSDTILHQTIEKNGL